MNNQTTGPFVQYGDNEGELYLLKRDILLSLTTIEASLNCIMSAWRDGCTETVLRLLNLIRCDMLNANKMLQKYVLIVNHGDNDVAEFSFLNLLLASLIKTDNEHSNDVEFLLNNISTYRRLNRGLVSFSKKLFSKHKLSLSVYQLKAIKTKAMHACVLVFCCILVVTSFAIMHNALKNRFILPTDLVFDKIPSYISIKNVSAAEKNESGKEFIWASGPSFQIDTQVELNTSVVINYIYQKIIKDQNVALLLNGLEQDCSCVEIGTGNNMFFCKALLDLSKGNNAISFLFSDYNNKDGVVYRNDSRNLAAIFYSLVIKLQ